MFCYNFDFLLFNVNYWSGQEGFYFSQVLVSQRLYNSLLMLYFAFLKGFG